MMTEAQAFAEINATLKAKGFKEFGKAFADYSGQLLVQGIAVDVTVSIPDVRFVRSPIVKLVDRKQVPVPLLAHIGDDGVCYQSSVGLPLDMYAPGAAILRILEDAKETLELSFGNRGVQEMVKEYQMHWRGETYFSSFIRFANAPQSPFKCPIYAFADSAGTSKMALSFQADLPGWKSTLLQQALVIASPTALHPESTKPPPETFAELETWYKDQAVASDTPWSKCAAALANLEILVIKAENAYIGVELTLPADLKVAKAKKVRPNILARALLGRASTVKIQRHSIHKLDIESITNRGGATKTNLAGKRIAIIGCGTIGGFLARLVAQSGAGSGDEGRLIVLDNQILSEGNIGRHLLGVHDVGKPKAEAVATELLRFHPQCNVKAIYADLADSWSEVQDCDLVIEATGEWNVQNLVNNLYLDEPKSDRAVLHTFVLMNGAAVQTFMNMHDDFACFRCLKPEFDKPWRFPAADPALELNLHPASCNDGAFVPFSVDAPSMAASLAVRAALDWASGKPGPRLRSIEVDLPRARKQAPISPQPAKHCPACGWRRAGADADLGKSAPT